MSEPQNKGLNELLFNKLLDYIESCSFHKYIDLHIVTASPGEIILETTINEAHLNPQKIAHGGITYSLADIVMGMSVSSLNRTCVTMEANINYIKPGAEGQILRGYGKVITLNRKIIISCCEIKNDSGELIAIARGTYYDKGPMIEELD
jgi:acyl-CoA thioesterase